MKYYKAFDENLKCRDFQYEVGKEYEIEGEPVICKRGFHFCETIVNCYVYYPKDDSPLTTILDKLLIRSDGEEVRLWSQTIGKKEQPK